MSTLPKDRTFHLWALTSGTPVCLGLLGANPQIAVFAYEGDMTSLMITAEPAGGVQSPTLPVLASGAIDPVA